MLRLLKKSLIFKGLEEKKIQEILKETKYKIEKYKIGESLVFRGDKVQGLNIVLKGNISAEMLAKDGNIRKIEDLYQSDVLAAAFIFGMNNNFPVDLVANEETEIFVIDKSNFLKILSRENIILENFLNEISNKAQLLSAKIWDGVNNKTIEEKVWNFIRKNQKQNIVVIKNLKNLAEKFGVARPSLSRVIAELIKNEKIERVGRSTYKILENNFIEG